MPTSVSMLVFVSVRQGVSFFGKTFFKNLQVFILFDQEFFTFDMKFHMILQPNFFFDVEDEIPSSFNFSF